MNSDGTQQRQMTFENQNNWFAHISPDQKKVINIAYSKDGLDPDEHLPNMGVELWIMNTPKLPPLIIKKSGGSFGVFIITIDYLIR